MTDDPKCVAGCVAFYGGEKRHHKDCPHYPESLTKVNADRIEELVKERDKFEALALMNLQENGTHIRRAEAAEAKLAKAVEWFKKLDRRGDALETFDPVVHEIVTAALAELEGK